MVLQKFEYGESALYFTQNSPSKNAKKTVGLSILPKGAAFEGQGTDAPLFYAEFADSFSVPVKVLRQVQFLSGSLNCYLADENGAEYVQKIVYDRDTGVFTLNFRFENRGKEEKTLRSFSAFSLGAACKSGLKIYRMGAAYSYAYAVQCDSVESLGLGFENSPPLSFGKDFRYLPFLAIDTGEGVLAIRLDAPDKFEMLLRRKGAMLELLGFEKFALKPIPAGGFFETSKVHITLQKDLNSALSALNKRMQKKLSSEEENFVFCSTEGVSLGSMKKFASLLKELKIPAAVLEQGKKAKSEEELLSAAQKLAAEGIRAERGLKGLFPLPPFERATAIAAANLTRILPARKIVAPFPVKAEEGEERVIFNFCAAAMARVKLCGEVMKLDEGRIELLKSLLLFYERVRRVVEFGEVTNCAFSGTIGSAPQGKLFYEKCFEGEKLLIFHCFEEEGSFKIPLEGYEVEDKICSPNAAASVRGETLKVVLPCNEAGAFLLKKREI